MFYSDTLLSKTGPLARVWLASNMERKLTKKDCLSSNLESSIEVMVDQGSAPMALRLSGQLLLGVVRIYNRKARYLLEDCNEALLKIKMAFRPGNVDLPADQILSANAAALTLPDSLTEMDLLANLPDVALLLGEGVDLGRLTGETGLTLDWGTQNLIPDSSGKRDSEIPRAYDDGDHLGLDLGDDVDFTSGLDIERGRDRVASPWGNEYIGDTSKLNDDSFGLDLGDDEPVNNFSMAEPTIGADVEMADLNLDLGDDIPALNDRPQRTSGSPLSDIRPSAEQELNQAANNTSLYLPEPESIHEVAQRIKRRKVIQLDSDLELKNSQIREQQNDRSKTMKPASFLPRDPLLLALLNMQKNGDFVKSILGNGRTLGWAPELRDILSVDIVRRTGDLKRKRDSGVSDMYLEDQPALELPEDESAMLPEGELSALDMGGMQEELPSMHRDEEGQSPAADFDETTIPLLHPADAGPISQGTHHAVHLLRDHFGPGAESSPGQRQKTSVLFQDLLPERTTNRSNATKMFFEILVLATKDAVKVEQKLDVIGAPLRVRAKRGLWGAWAEQSAGGQITTDTQAGADE